jgi:hypothetical protein
MTKSEKPTSVRLPVDLRSALAQASTEQGCSVNFKINQILREWAEKKGFNNDER